MILTYEWWNSVYASPIEQVPTHAAKRLGIPDIFTCYANTNMHDTIVSNSSLTGIIHLPNRTHIKAFSKTQATVETATNRSEMLAICACVEQIVSLYNILRYPVEYIPSLGRAVMHSLEFPYFKAGIVGDA